LSVSARRRPAIINDVLAARLVGRDAFDIAGAEEVCLPYWTGVQSINDRSRIMAFGAIEMALWDLRGKAWKQPLYQLLGGAVRKDIPFTDYFSAVTDQRSKVRRRRSKLPTIASNFTRPSGRPSSKASSRPRTRKSR
jgi:L-alanine-DL-glutamate epimerase-like enolase superfamily enzyme